MYKRGSHRLPSKRSSCLAGEEGVQMSQHTAALSPVASPINIEVAAISTNQSLIT